MDKIENNVILNTSVRFFRNVRDVPFVSRFTPDDARDIDVNVKMICDTEWGTEKYDVLNVNLAESCDIQYWSDKNCCGVRTGKTEYERMAFTNSYKGLSVVTNESEHLLVQAMADGCETDKTYKDACEAVNALSRRIPFAASDEYGFLTANPLCTGTAMKAGALAHLPALSIIRQTGAVKAHIAGLGVSMKGFYTEGETVYGALYQLANKYTLGITENEEVDCVKAAIQYVINAENECRSAIMGSNGRFIYDMAWRSAGAVALARTMDMKEFMVNISNLRLGAELGILDIDVDFVNELFMYGQMGYVHRYMVKKSLENEPVDYVRARILREAAAPVLKGLL